MIVDRRASDACPAPMTLCSVDLSAEQLQELDAIRARAACGADPKTPAEKDAYILLKVLELARVRCGLSDVIPPKSIMALSDSDVAVWFVHCRKTAPRCSED